MRSTFTAITFAASLGLSGPSTADPVELLINGSFETADFAAWSAQQSGASFRPWGIDGAGAGGGFGMDPTSPQDGSYVAWNGFDGSGPMEFTLDQEVFLPADYEIYLTWQQRIQWNFTLGNDATETRLAEVQILDPLDLSVLDTVYSFSTGTQDTNPTGDTGWTTEGVDLSIWGSDDYVILRFVQYIPESQTGPGQFEIDGISLLAEMTDRDGDGIPDAEDECPDSDLADTVIIDGCDSGIINILWDDGCTIADILEDECASNARNHGAYVRCVARESLELYRSGYIKRTERGPLLSCAAKSSIGRH